MLYVLELTTKIIKTRTKNKLKEDLIIKKNEMNKDKNDYYRYGNCELNKDLNEKNFQIKIRIWLCAQQLCTHSVQSSGN